MTDRIRAQSAASRAFGDPPTDEAVFLKVSNTRHGDIVVFGMEETLKRSLFSFAHCGSIHRQKLLT